MNAYVWLASSFLQFRNGGQGMVSSYYKQKLGWVLPEVGGHTFSPSTQEEEEGRCEFKASLACRENSRAARTVI